MNASIHEQEQARNELIGALVGLSRALEGKEVSRSAMQAMAGGLSLSLPGCIADPAVILEMTQTVRKEKEKAAPDCASCQSPCGRTSDYNMEEMWTAQAPLRTKKYLLLTALCSVGSAACRAMLCGTPDEEIFSFLRDGLFLLGYAFEENQLDPVLSKADRMYALCL